MLLALEDSITTRPDRTAAVDVSRPRRSPTTKLTLKSLNLAKLGLLEFRLVRGLG